MELPDVRLSSFLLSEPALSITFAPYLPFPSTQDGSWDKNDTDAGIPDQREVEGKFGNWKTMASGFLQRQNAQTIFKEGKTNNDRIMESCEWNGMFFF